MNYNKSNSGYELDIQTTYEGPIKRYSQDYSSHSIDTGFGSTSYGVGQPTTLSTSSATTTSNNQFQEPSNYSIQSIVIDNNSNNTNKPSISSKNFCAHTDSYASEFDCVKSITSSMSTIKNQQIMSRSLIVHGKFANKSDDFNLEEVKSLGGDSTCSEIDSIKTEEFSDVFNHYSNLTDENLKLHELNQQNKQVKHLKQLAGIPILSFDPKNIDSDLDTIKSELIRDKFKEFKLKSQNKEQQQQKVRKTFEMKRSKSSDSLSQQSSTISTTRLVKPVSRPPPISRINKHDNYHHRHHHQQQQNRYYQCPNFANLNRAPRLNNTNLIQDLKNKLSSNSLTTMNKDDDLVVVAVNTNTNNNNNNNNKTTINDTTNSKSSINNSIQTLTATTNSNNETQQRLINNNNNNTKDAKTSSNDQQEQQQNIVNNNTNSTNNNNTAKNKGSVSTSNTTVVNTQMDPTGVGVVVVNTSPNYSSCKYSNLNKSYRADRLLRISEKSPEFHAYNSTNSTTSTKHHHNQQQLLNKSAPLNTSLTRTRSFNPSMFASSIAMYGPADTDLNNNSFNTSTSCKKAMMQQQLIDYSIYADQVNKYREDLSYSKSELLKTKIKKEQLETEIELLENQIKQRRGELRHSFTSLNECDYETNTLNNRLNQSVVETTKQKFSIKSDKQHPFSYDDVMKLISERDVLRHKLYYDNKTYKENSKFIEQQLSQTKDELLKEQKTAKDKVVKLEEELECAKKRLEETVSEKDNLVGKVNTLENKLVTLQHDLNKKERESYNQLIAENTEKHLTSLCQTLTSQIEDLRAQLKLSEEKCKRLESEQLIKFEKFESQTLQIDNLKKELELSNESYQKLKKNAEDQLISLASKEKELIDSNNRVLKDKEDEVTELRLQLAEAKNIRFNNQELHDALIHDFKKTISKQDDEIRSLEEALKLKQNQFETFQREFEQAVGPRVDERIRNEKILWEQEQNFLIRRELSKLNEEKSKEIQKIQDELNVEKEKAIFERDKCVRLEKEIEELNQEIKFANKEKSLAITKAREAMKLEVEKVKIEAYNEKQEEINKLKRLIKDYEDEIQRLKVEQQQNVEKDREFIVNVEKLEKNLIKEINEEQRKLSSLIPGIMPKLVNYSNLRSIYSVKNVENALTLNTFQIAFSNLKNLLEEVTQNYQNLKQDNEQTKRQILKVSQEKEESIESIKRQYERQKQKELETIREYVSKDSDSMNTYTNEVSSLVAALKNKDREIQDIQENMSGWKKDTLAKLAEKFEVELNKELDRRMQEHKTETTNQQIQLDKIRKEMDTLIKDYRQTNQNQISQEQHERMVRYLQSRLNDLRDENLALRERFKSSNFMQQHLGILNTTKSITSDVDYQHSPAQHSIDSMKNVDLNNADDDMNNLYTPSLDGEDQLESKNELLQQKLNELQKLQMQLNNVKS